MKVMLSHSPNLNTAELSTQDDENRWPVTSGHGQAGSPRGTAARRSAATWNIPDRMRMLFSREPLITAGPSTLDDGSLFPL
jgi:hypothetical protein